MKRHLLILLIALPLLAEPASVKIPFSKRPMKPISCRVMLQR